MKDKHKTKEQLVNELVELRQRITELEASETERVRAEEALKTQARILESMVEGVNVSDQNAILLFTNPAFDAMFGYERGELIGKYVSILNADPPEENARIVAEIIEQLKTRGAWFGEFNNIKKDGTPFTTYARISALEVSGKQCWVSVQEDITERKRAEEELERLYEQAQRDAEIKATLLDEVNHRVKNNLLAIVGLLYAERRYAERTDQAAYRAITQSLINRLGGLTTVHSLLVASDWASLPLSDLTGRVIRSSLQMLPRHKGVSVEVTPSPVRVTPDQAHSLALVINELTTNTVKHALEERDTAHIAVRITLEDEDDTVRFEFRDDGPGYPEDVLQLERYRVGFDLIQNMVRTGLRGELSLHNDDGAVAVIRFKAQA